MNINMSEIDYAAMLREEAKRTPHGQHEVIFEALVNEIESGNADDEIDCAPAELLMKWNETGDYKTVEEIANLSDDDPTMNPAEIAAEVYPYDHYIEIEPRSMERGSMERGVFMWNDGEED